MRQMPDILVTTLGNWQILPELMGLTNPDLIDLFKHHPRRVRIDNSRKKFDISPVDELWVVSTSGAFIDRSLITANNWYNSLNRSNRPRLRIWQVEETENLATEEECLKMCEAIHTIVYKASIMAKGGSLFLSLTGGRKTMSTDLQKAAAWFGCHAMVHVVDNSSWPGAPDIRKMGVEEFLTPLPAEYKDLFTPFVVGKFSPNPILSISNTEIPPLDGVTSDLPFSQDSTPMRFRVNPAFPLIANLDRRQSDAGYLMCNYTNTMLQGETVTNFLALYSLPEKDIDALKQLKIGCNQAEEAGELELLKSLPKAELHCHLGGVADVHELIRIAGAAREDIDCYAPKLDGWSAPVKRAVKNRDVALINRLIFSIKEVRYAVAGVPPHITTASFIMMFKDDPELLEQVIYGPCMEELLFCGVGFKAYERAGDLQGSGILKHPACLREACRVIAEKAIAHGVLYLEVRCSPVNYAGEELSELAVYEIIRDTLAEYASELTCSLIFIASRHGEVESVYRHVELACQILTIEEKIGHTPVPLRGFDLAGDEGACSAAKMQNLLMPIMEQCLHFTIHAGENHPPQSIWEAVYLLNAERIGHCLTLNEHPKLMERFLDRNIVLEMCPSSNFQIIGYRDKYLQESWHLPVYPLKEYLDAGLRVTVNSDNPGISRTDFSRELHRACRMTPGGLSMWEILSIVRNSFKASFAPRHVRHEILRRAEEMCVRLLRSGGWLR